MPRINSLRLQVLRKPKDKTVKDKYATKTHQLHRLKNLRQKYLFRGNKIGRLKVRLERNAAKVRKITDIGSEHAVKGDTKGLSRTLKIAFDTGLLSDKKNTLTFMRNMLKNINKKAKGKRYLSFTKSFYEVVKIWGGKRMLKF